MDGCRVAIIGAGLMGRGLARLFAGVGWHTAITDPDAAARALVRQEVRAAHVCTDLTSAVSGAALVIEAAPERLQLKQDVFAALVRLAPQGVPLCTNSSVIPVGAIASLLPDGPASRIIGTHFWNPPDLIPLVEVIQGPRSDPAIIARAMAMLRAAGKEPVHVRGDTVPGNRLQHALWREAMALVDEGVCDPAEVDDIVKRSFGLRLAVLGPLENADLVGLGLTADIHRTVLPTLSRATEPAACLRDRLERGHGGVGDLRGFYPAWTPQAVQRLRDRLGAHLRRLLAAPAEP